MSSGAFITIVGNLGSDAEQKILPSGTPVCNFSVAVNDNRDKTAPATWFNVAAFGQLGQSVGQYLKKSTHVTVIGSFRVRKYTTAQGVAGEAYEVNATSIVLGGGPRESTEAAGGTQTPDNLSDIPF